MLETMHGGSQMTEYSGKHETDPIPLDLALHHITSHHIALTYLSIEAIISTHSSFGIAEGALSGTGMLRLKLFC
jgi:hypothetical protein